MAASSPRPGHPEGAVTRWRNRADAGTCRVCDSGHSAKAIGTRKPNAAASSSGTTSTPPLIGSGMISPNAAAMSAGATAPAAMPMAIARQATSRISVR